MMTVHKLSAGDGYTYYISETASADELRAKGRELGDYYTVSGNPPGVWMGGGIANLGVTGTVTEAQMKALFGEGLHPNAEAMIEAGMNPRDTRLGRGFYQYDGSETAFSRSVRAGYKEFERRHKKAPDVDQRRQIRGRIGGEAFFKAHGRRAADKEELGRFMTAQEKPKQQAVTGYDLTFAPPKSVSLLWALGGEEARKAAERAHEKGIAAAIKHLEERGVYTRSGFNGVEQRNVKGGLIITRFRHHDSRTGDPHLHDHAVVSNRVLSEDGTWLTLDGQQIFKLNVEISEVYQAEMFQELCSDMGLATVQRDVGGNRTVTELAGVSEAMIKRGSGRGSTLRARTCELVREFTETHGYSPTMKQRIKLAQQANLDTRPAKQSPKSPKEDIAAWAKDYRGAGLDVGKAFVKAVTKASKIETAKAMTAEELDIPEIAVTVLETVSSARAVWGETHIRSEATRQLGYAFKGQKVPETAVLAITDYALNTGSIALNTEARTHHAKELYRADGASALVKANTALYTSTNVLAAEDALLTAAHQDVIPAAAKDAFELALSARSLRGKVELNAAQAEFARTFACSPKMIVAGIGPAGTGKTTALSVAAEAVNIAGGKVIGLATAASAADVLRKDLTDGRDTAPEQITTETVAKFLHAHGTGKLEGLALKPGDVVIVDEAGMASTRDLAAVLAIAEGAGALVRFAGDHNQLSSIGAGGALRLIAHQVGAVELEEVHRFRNPDGTPNTEEAAASLTLRDPEEVRGAAAFDWYRDNGRIVAGGKDRMVNDAYAAWQHAVDNGESALMMAPDNATVRELNARAQAYRVAAGVITGRRSAPLADEAEAHIGDTVLARQIDRKLRMHQGKDWVKNGDLYTVLKVHSDGGLTVRHDAHNGTITLPAAYVKEQVQLGYAATFNRAQGATVDRAFAILKKGVTRAQAYVGATRGRFINMLFGVLDTAEDNEIIHDTQDLEELLESIGNHVDRNLSAHELIDAADTEQHSVARMRAEYINTDLLAQEARTKLLLRAALGDGQAQMFIDGEAFGALAHRIREAETAGLDAAGIIATAYHQRDFDDARTASAVLEWRIKGLTVRSVELLEAASERPLRNLSDAQLAQLKAIALGRHHRAQNHLLNGVALTAPDGTPVPVRYPAGVQPWNKRMFGHLNDETLDARIAKAENDALYLLPSTQAKKIRANTWLQQELAKEKELRTTLPAATFISETAERGVLSVWTDTEEHASELAERIDERGVQDTPEAMARRKKLMDGAKPWHQRTFGYLSDEALDTRIKKAENDALHRAPATPAKEIKDNTALHKELLKEKELRAKLSAATDVSGAGLLGAEALAPERKGKAGRKPRMGKDAAAGSRNRLNQAGTILERITTEEKLRTILPDPAALAEAATIKATLEKAVPEWIAPTHALAHGLATGTIAETWTAELLEARDRIAVELGWAGAILAHEQPVWTAALGPVPSDPVRRVEWENTAAQVAVFRETYNIPAHEAAPVPAEYLDKTPGEPQTGDLLKAAVTRIHKYTAQTHKARATAESLSAAAAQARAEQLATGRTDAQDHAAARLRQRAARVTLSPTQQRTLDAHNTADAIAGTTPPPAEYLTGRPDPQTPGTAPDGGEPALVPAGGPGPGVEAQAQETAPEPARPHPADIPYKTTTVQPGAMDHPSGTAATAELPVMAEPAPEPVLSRAEKAAARAVEYAQKLQDHADRADAAAQARARAHELRNTTTTTTASEAPEALDTPVLEPVTQAAPAPDVVEATPGHAPAAPHADAVQAGMETSPVTDPVAPEHVKEQVSEQSIEHPVDAVEQQPTTEPEQLHTDAPAQAPELQDEAARWQRDAFDRQAAIQADAIERLETERAKQAEKDKELAQESARQLALRKLFPEMARQPRDVQDRALERRFAEMRRQTLNPHAQDPADGREPDALQQALDRAKAERRPQPRVEIPDTPAGQETESRPEFEAVLESQRAAERIRGLLSSITEAAEPDTAAGHAAEDFLHAQQPGHSPAEQESADESYVPVLREPEKTLTQRLAEIRAAQDKKTAAARDSVASDETKEAVERLRRTLEELKQRQQEQEPAPHQPGPEPEGPGIRGPRL